MYKSIIFFLLSSVLMMSCSSSNRNNEYQVLADSLNMQCPVELMNGEVEITRVECPGSKFFIYLTLRDEAPVTIASLSALDDEYARRVEETKDFDVEIKRFGTLPFLMGVVDQSDALGKMIRTIELATSTPESTQGFLPLEIGICDANDTLTYTYNVEWAGLSEAEWLNAIVPMEMRDAFGWMGRGEQPRLNKEVAFDGFPVATEDGTLDIDCSYEAMPGFKDPSAPIRLKDIRGKYFSASILKDYLKTQAGKHRPTKRFLNACAKRNISVRFLLTGVKDEIDPDLASPQSVKEWESWGGNDTITIAMQELRSLLK